MSGYFGAKRSERGLSTVAVVMGIGFVVVTIGLAILASTDSQVRDAFLSQKQRDSDWTVRSAIKLTEEAWRRYIGVTPREDDPNRFNGTVYNNVEIHSREEDLVWAIANADNTNPPEQKYSLLIMRYAEYAAKLDTPEEFNLYPLDINEIPGSYTYQVDLTNDNRDHANDAIVLMEPGDNIIWNSIDADGRRRFHAEITVTPNGHPHYTDDNTMFVFPIKFELTLNTVNEGLQDGKLVNRTVKGFGSCAIYVFRRSFGEYVMFCDTFKMSESGREGEITIPYGFRYEGPVHTNTVFAFTSNYAETDDPQSAVFTDVVTQAGSYALYNGEQSTDETKYGTDDCKPTFGDGDDFYMNVKPITLPQSLGPIQDFVLKGRTIVEPGVYLPVSGGAIGPGGIYVKGDVTSLTLSQGDRQQTYSIDQTSRGTPSIKTTYYNTNNCTGTEYSTLNTSRRSMKKEYVTPVSGYRYIITSNYAKGETTWRKELHNYTERVIRKYNRTSSSDLWTLYENTTTPDPPIPVSVESEEVYSGLIDVVEAPEDVPETPQAAIYIDGNLGSGASDVYNLATGLSGVVDKETELTICARGNIVITEDTIYERNPDFSRMDQQGILGILSENGKVQIDYVNPVNNAIDLDAAIMAPSKDGNGVLTCIDYRQALGYPDFNFYGGVVQYYYGAVANGSNGYRRNFVYDPRLRRTPPPLYPKQAACRMQHKNEDGDNTLQLVWKY